MAVNKKTLVLIWKLLKRNNITTWISGRCAEELLGIPESQEKQSIELLYPSEHFEAVDQMLKNSDEFTEDASAHAPHRRVLMYQGIRIEILLVQQDGKTNFRYTYFWDQFQLWWPQFVFSELNIGSYGLVNIVSAQALMHFHKHADTIRMVETMHSNT